MAADNPALALLKANLGYTAGTTPAEVTLLLENDLAAARQDLQRIGIGIVDADAADLNLLVMYAAWLYRKRVTGEGRPPMLQIIINDRKVAKATGADA